MIIRIVFMNGLRLRELRRDRDMSQEQLAHCLKVSMYTISSYERGKSSPSDEDKVIIAKFFDVSLDYLFGLVDKPCSYRRERGVSLPPRVSDDELQKIQEYADMVVGAKRAVRL
jgi:transcriptional regulator with XRE-family HTH domain